LKRFYFEPEDLLEGGWYIIEAEGGHEHGAYFDVAIAIVTEVEDAKTLCDKLNYLYELTKKEQ
jgi:hypothetical protein